jgi:hypothetical protein
MAFTTPRTRYLNIDATAVLLFSGIAFSCFALGARAAHGSGSSQFNQPGNVLISDQFNNRVIEVDSNHNIVWSFGSGNPTLCNPGPGTIIGLNDAERLSGGLTILAGTGIPPILYQACKMAASTIVSSLSIKTATSSWQNCVADRCLIRWTSTELCCLCQQASQ